MDISYVRKGSFSNKEISKWVKYENISSSLVNDLQKNSNVDISSLIGGDEAQNGVAINNLQQECNSAS